MPRRRKAETVDEQRDFWLTNFLILISVAMFVAPLLSDLVPVVGEIGRPVFLIAFLAAPLAVVERKSTRVWFLAFAFLLTGLAVTDEFLPDRTVHLAMTCLMLIFIVSLAGLVLQQVLREGIITGHRIKGSVAFYLLVAVAFQLSYILLVLFNPDSISFPREIANFEDLFSQLLHFSCSTLTTVGYGNIAPVSKAAETLANLEGLIGQLYPAILIARLVSLRAD